MEIMQLGTQFIDETDRTWQLSYTIFHEQAENDFPSGYSIMVEMKRFAYTETAVAHRISDLKSVQKLAETLCRNRVTPTTLHDVVADYISGADSF